MAGKVDIVALGELLIDFTEAGFSANGQKLFDLVIFWTIVRIFLLIILLHNYDFEKPNSNQNTN